MVKRAYRRWNPSQAVDTSGPSATRQDEESGGVDDVGAEVPGFGSGRLSPGSGSNDEQNVGTEAVTEVHGTGIGPEPQATRNEDDPDNRTESGGGQNGDPARRLRGQSKMTEKKGNKSWRPATALELRKREGFRQRWCSSDPKDVQKKIEEGWQFSQAHHIKQGHAEGGTPLTTTTTYRELVAMELPEEIAKERDAYYQGLAEKQERGLKRQAQEQVANVGPKAQVHGKIVIE